METVTLHGPVVVLSAEEYQNLLNRLARLESIVNRLTQLMEDIEDIKVMREAEAEYLAGDVVDFADLLSEVQEERD
jgi:PHD/YefM family antitoxin component YafN of YafNO toxin-antitoxin module